MLDSAYYIIIYRIIGAPVHRKYVVYGINPVDINHLYNLMYTLNMPVNKGIVNGISVHTLTQKSKAILTK